MIDRFKDQYLISQCCENVLIGDYDIDLQNFFDISRIYIIVFLKKVFFRKDIGY